MAEPMLDLALLYASRGWPVFPCRPNEKRPKTEHGCKDATVDEKQIRAWWKRTPTANVGIATGNGLLVVDVDDPSALPALNLPPTYTVQTPSGGTHHYFTVVDDLGNTASRLADDVDTRGLGGYVVAPPSVVDGAPYTVIDARDPVPLPDHVRAMFAERRQRERRADVTPHKPPVAWAQRALENEVQAVAMAAAGSRNETLNRAAYNLGQLVGAGHLHGYMVADELIRAAESAGLPTSEAEQTVNSGMSAGISNPRNPPQRTLEVASRPKTTIASAGGSVLALSQQDAPNVDEALNVPRQKFALLHWVVRNACADVLAFSVTENQVIWTAQPFFDLRGPFPRRIREEDLAHAQSALEEKINKSLTSGDVKRAIEAVARARVIDELQEYIDGVAWDGTPRIDTWLRDYMGAADDERTRKVGRWWLISAVARAKVPGTQADHVLVLEGGQGAGKSTALRILGGEWFTDAPLDLSHKDSSQLIAGKWIIEFAELDSLKRADQTRIKAFITRLTEEYRPSHAPFVVKQERRCVFAATTNEATYLHDDTGNRRFWPVPIGRINLAALRADRDQLWAEAAHAYRQGAKWWPESEEDAAMLAAVVEDRRAEDPWIDALATWASDRLDATTSEALNVVGVPVDRRDRSHEMRAGRVLRALGFERTRAKYSGQGSRKRVYRRVEQHEGAETGPSIGPLTHLRGGSAETLRNISTLEEIGGPSSPVGQRGEKGPQDAEKSGPTSEKADGPIGGSNQRPPAEPPIGAATGSPAGGHPSPPDTAADASGDDWRSAAADIVTDLWGPAEEP